MTDIILAVFGVLIVAAAVMALYSKDIVSAIMGAGLVSLLASVTYLVVGAPDVAMTEAAIGSALSTVIFLFAWGRIRAQRRSTGAAGTSDAASRVAGDDGVGPADDFDEGPRTPGGGTNG